MIRVRNFFLWCVYRACVRPILFLFDPEKVHDKAIIVGAFLGKYKIGRWVVSLFFSYHNPILEQRIAGIMFKNPVGLAAGFDKDGQMISITGSIGFGYIEIGSVTAQPHTGNPRPRLWRLVREKSLMVYYGLKNKGASFVKANIVSAYKDIPVGVSIAKTNSRETSTCDEGVDDFERSWNTICSVADYITLNISCPNVFGGCFFHETKYLQMLLLRLKPQSINKPIFLKLSPDLSYDQIDDIIKCAREHGITGFICTNLSKENTEQNKFNNMKGGISGRVIHMRAKELVSYVYQKTHGTMCIIGVGGIFSGDDAYAMIRAGASLVQVITGMIYEGPQSISAINYSLAHHLLEDGFVSISEAVGADYNTYL